MERDVGLTVHQPLGDEAAGNQHRLGFGPLTCSRDPESSRGHFTTSRTVLQ
jgi:hypothetical protein